MSTDSLYANNAFDAETTKILASAFDAAWEKVKASADLHGERHADAVRQLLAECIMAMAQQGERNPIRLVEDALRRLGRV